MLPHKGRSNAPPPLPAASSATPAPAQPGTARRTVARLPEAERAKQEASASESRANH